MANPIVPPAPRTATVSAGPAAPDPGRASPCICVVDTPAVPHQSLTMRTMGWLIVPRSEEHKVRRLPVIDGHTLVGMVSQGDLARAVNSERVGEAVGAISS